MEKVVEGGKGNSGVKTFKDNLKERYISSSRDSSIELNLISIR